MIIGMKRLAAVATAVAMTLTMFGAVDANAKAKKPSTQKKISMKVSQTKTLKISNVQKSKVKKIKWSSSNSKVVKLSKKKATSVKLSAKKVGKANVKANFKFKGKKYQLTTKVTVKAKGNTATTSKATSVPKSSSAATPTQVPSSAAKATDTPKPTNTPEPTPRPSAGPIKSDRPTSSLKTVDAIKKMESLPDPSTYTEKTQYAPDLLKMLDGTEVKTKEQWETRRQEISCILQRYMYGIWRDGSEDKVTYAYDEKNNQITITVSRNDAKGSFTASCIIPEGPAPEGGWPVVIEDGFGAGTGNEFYTKNGYAYIGYNYTDLASDDTSRKGVFYDLYPYGDTWKEQTGTCMAWAWGASKILDALFDGAALELGINPNIAIMTGVSRCGKAAAVAGAFDERFKFSMPVCSGFGGLTTGRYVSNGHTYSLLPEFANDPKAGGLASLDAWTSSGGNEPIGSIQYAGYLCDAYTAFDSYLKCPFDAHYLAALSAQPDRMLMMVTGINSDMWNAPPGLWLTYVSAKPAFDLIGAADNFGIQMHLDLHGIETIDLLKMNAFLKNNLYETEPDTSKWDAPWNEVNKDWKLSDLKTCIFATEANKEAYEAGLPKDPNNIQPNPDNKVGIKLNFPGGVTTDAEVSRNPGGDALVEKSGDGYKFTYGNVNQYGKSYARFKLVLPEGKKLSDYSSVTFDCLTDSSYYGKRMALVANPTATGMPEEIDYDYNTGKMTTAINLCNKGNDLPNNTNTTKNLSLKIDKTVAEPLDGNEVELSIYLHMENQDATCWYIINNINFVE